MGKPIAQIESDQTSCPYIRKRALGYWAADERVRLKRAGEKDINRDERVRLLMRCRYYDLNKGRPICVSNQFRQL